MESLKGELTRAQQDALTKLSGEWREKRRVKLVLRTPGGYGFSPMNEQGEVMSVDAFNQYSPKKNKIVSNKSWRTWKHACVKWHEG
jgi:hypothetical protein